jgi:hypothetical protein
VRRLLESHQSGRQDNHKLLFSLVMLEQWLRRDWLSMAQQRTKAAQVAS